MQFVPSILSPITRLDNGVKGRCLSSSLTFEDLWPALLLCPDLLVVGLGVDLELLQVGVDDFLLAVGALDARHEYQQALFSYMPRSVFWAMDLAGEGLLGNSSAYKLRTKENRREQSGRECSNPAM